MASPDTIILLIVDYHAAIGGGPPCPLAYAPGCSSSLVHSLLLVFDIVVFDVYALVSLIG